MITKTDISYIYTLSCPIINKVRYVGKANDPKQRFKNHLNKARDKNTHKRNWINKLRSEGLRPIFQIIHICSVKEWKDWEKFYIKKYKLLGGELVNYTDGGDGLTFGNKTSFKSGNGARAIVALNKDGTFNSEYKSTKEAELILNAPSISAALRKRSRFSANLLWLYKEDYETISKEDLDKFIKWCNVKKRYSEKSRSFCFKKGHVSWNNGFKENRITYKTNRRKSVVQIDLDGNYINEFECIADAASHLKCDSENIRSCCSGKTKIAMGYFWIYKEKYNTLSKEEVVKIVFKNRSSTDSIIVLRIDEDNNITEYSTMQKATKSNNMCVQTMNRIIKNNIIYKGFRYERKYKQ